MSDGVIKTIEVVIPVLMQFADYEERHFYECGRLAGKYCKHCDGLGMCWLRDRNTINTEEARKVVVDLNWLSTEIWTRLKGKITINASEANINERLAIATANKVALAWDIS
jgi:hypothetical protein